MTDLSGTMGFNARQTLLEELVELKRQMPELQQARSGNSGRCRGATSQLWRVQHYGEAEARQIERFH